eukprot:6176893-Pleurochrysis_carterae.AAC.2
MYLAPKLIWDYYIATFDYVQGGYIPWVLRLEVRIRPLCRAAWAACRVVHAVRRLCCVRAFSPHRTSGASAAWADPGWRQRCIDRRGAQARLSPASLYERLPAHLLPPNDGEATASALQGSLQGLAESAADRYLTSESQ